MVPGGNIIIARLITNSGIWEKDALYLKLWIWLIREAAYNDNAVFKGHSLKRGEMITTYGKLLEALSYRSNRALIKISQKKIRLILEWMKTEGMITVEPFISGSGLNNGTPKALTRVYSGIKIFIINYDTYQNVKNYKGADKGIPRDEQGQLRITKKNNKNYDPDFFLELKTRYQDSWIIESFFQALEKTRMTGKMADSVKLKILKSWEKYSVSQVVSGIRIYLEKNYADQGKNENYLLGIIKKQDPEKIPQQHDPENLFSQPWY